LNYWVDASIGIAFVLSAISGLVFLLPVDFGSSSSLLGVSHRVWDSLHTWSSLTVIGGVLLHLLLHWKWIAHMTGKVMPAQPSLPQATVPTSGTAMTRRQFISLGFAVVAGGAVAGCAGVAGAHVVDLVHRNSGGALFGDTEQSVQLGGGVACPRGMVNDPYPGRCKYYVDSNRDGFCDYSVPGSGNN